ncbi:cupin domain-containing protein [Microbacter sp. GSS18]|nr:cupin domain-containing protein [Microbacter sp. GSS18]
MSQHLGNAFDIDLGSIEYPSLEDGSTIGAGRHLIGNLSDTRIGLWEAEPGLIGGVTNDEIFVVLEGRAEVTFDDTGEVIQIGPGDIVRLKAGQSNHWRTFERIRKVAVSIPAQA